MFFSNQRLTAYLSIFVFTCVATIQTAHSQNFNFITSKSGDKNPKEIQGYKHTVAQQVFSNLLAVQGRTNMPEPSFVLSDGGKNMASLDPQNLQISLEEKAYDLCTEMGPDSLNALAALLGYELCLYYQQQPAADYFNPENADLSTGKALESQAFFWSAMLANSAGYQVDGSLAGLLKKLYKGYKTPKNLPGYPALNDRLVSADSAMLQYRAQITMLETSKLLTILAAYDVAAIYQNSILSNYKSKELLATAGLNNLMAALEYVGPGEVPFILPTELDPTGRLVDTRNLKNDPQGIRKSSLMTAVSQFNQIIAWDSSDLSAYLNKVCALTLLGDFTAAETCAAAGKARCSTQKLTTDFLVMEGIIAALQGINNPAAQAFEKAKRIGSYLAVQNLNILRDKKPPALAETSQVDQKGIEKIEWLLLDEFLAKPDLDIKIPVTADMYCGTHQKKLSRIYYHSANSGKDYILVHETNDKYQGNTNRGIILKSSSDNVQEAYGVPKRNFAVPEGFVWVYPEANIFFRFKNRSELISWGVYRKSGE